MKSVSTKRHYAGISAYLTERAAGAGVAVDHVPDFLAWAEAEAQRKMWSAATGRLYRAALVWRYERDGDLTAAGKAAKVRLCVEDPPLRLAARKQKSLPITDLGALLVELRRVDTDTASAAADWLISGCIAGLRPCEWETVVFDAGARLLTVSNAKATNGRAHGPTRTIGLTDVTDDELGAIAAHVARCQVAGAAGEFASLYNAVRKSVSRATSKLWPRRKRRPALYSARHQVSANLKASGWTLEEIAAVFGHASALTASVHYGRRQYGDRRASIRPSPADVEAVRRSTRSLGRRQFPYQVPSAPAAPDPTPSLDQDAE